MISQGEPISEAEGEELGWGAVVCVTDRNNYRALHARIGQEGYLYWSEPGIEGPTYPWLWGDENVTLWHDPHERTT